MRRAAKRDANEPAIVAALEADGCSVHPISDADGFPDLVVYSRKTRRTHLLEVKMPGETFTPRQKAWHAAWPGPAHVVRTIEEALMVVREAA